MNPEILHLNLDRHTKLTFLLIGLVLPGLASLLRAELPVAGEHSEVITKS